MLRYVESSSIIREKGNPGFPFPWDIYVREKRHDSHCMQTPMSSFSHVTTQPIDAMGGAPQRGSPFVRASAADWLSIKSIIDLPDRSNRR